MSIVSRLRDLLHEFVDPDERAPDHELRLTVAAVLTLITRVDGRVLSVEQEGLTALLRSRFGLSEEGVERLIDHVDELNQSSDAATTLVSHIQQEVGPDERPMLLGMAYRIAAVDGYVHEFEDNLIWRIGRLLGFDDAAVSAIRDDALRNLTPEQARRA
jgi:uncharacterized tellurite resistance protein B-like protein